MEISALTRSVVKRNHAIIAPDGYINSNVPGWTNCTVNVIINEQMGARLCQTLVTLRAGGRLEGRTQASQIFFYVVEGECEVTIGGVQQKLLTQGQFVYVPIEQEYQFRNHFEGTRILTFHKVYEPLAGQAVPNVIFGERDLAKAPVYMNDEALRIQELLPNELGFDMAVNIFTYSTGGHLPMVETHIMEHGLMYLQGQAIYMLDNEWYPVKQGDSIWMAPYCQQWATAMGQENSVYIYYKNVNRFPTAI
ncbi:(S)-ureidoglycine aminohydrolase [Hymenobacter daecheongensis DSM 21074]|uniref:(S)-ureidoglycine aminohydrolase n=1 Tax=Hymenobacter daecheongensis DSM 21074 TaxID=1121955 RepID=A0A1M6KNH4_9BACT|nr:(S)-ureidoglycine aminohydrolase [Hymenobacter daecheongensis]SHJ60434.1 (S)-ureidoglycine aminohydrolase [Hymenobacter daecheongensis DSM 21074]